jgi:hypothetical protein
MWEGRLGERSDVEPGPPAESVTLNVPPAIRDWWEALVRAWTGVDTAAMALTLLQVPVLLWLLVPGSFYIDDFRGQGQAAGQPVLSYLFASAGSHFSPGPHLIDVLQVHFAPLQHGPAVALTVVLRLVLGLSAWWLLRELFGPRRAALVPLGVLLASPALVPVSGWFRQSITVLPAIIVIAVSTRHHVRYLRSGRIGQAAAAAAWLAVGLCFYEKPVVLVPWLACLTLLYYPVGAGLRGRMRGVGRALPGLALYTLVVGLFFVVYVSGPYDRGSARSVGFLDVVNLGRVSLGESILPSALGGPWRWDFHTPYYGIALTPGWLVVLTLVAWVGFWAVCLLRDPGRAGRAFALFASYYIVVLMIVAVGRLGRVGIAIGRDYRLWADTLLPLVVCAALAILPLRDEAVPSPQRRVPRQAALWARPAFAVVALAAVVGAGMSTAGWAQQWHRNPADAYVSRVLLELEQTPSTDVVFPTTLPPSVLPWWIEPDFTLEDLLAPVHPNAEYRVADSPFRVPDNSGHLTRGRLITVAEQVPGQGICGYAHEPGSLAPVIVPLRATAPYYSNSALRLGLLVGSSTSFRVSVRQQGALIELRYRTPIELPRGPHVLLLRLPDATRVDAIQVSVTRPQAGVCVQSASVAAVVAPGAG